MAILDMLTQQRANYNILGYVDEKKTALSLRYLGNDSRFVAHKRHIAKRTKLIMCIGTHMALRRKLFNFFKSKGYGFLTYVHSRAAVSPSAYFGEGSVIFPGAVLGAFVKTGSNVCIYSNAVIEHKTYIGEHSYISPGVTIAGNCHIGSSSFFGINAGVADSVCLKNNTKVGAGAVVLQSFSKENITLLGVPASISKR